MTDRFDWKVTIAGVDVSKFVRLNGTIDHGRASVFGGFSAPRVTFDLFTAEGWPAEALNLPTVEPGDQVIITVTDTAHAVPYEHGRFHGNVRALEWSQYTLRVVAVGVVADWQNVLSGFPALEGGTPAEKDDVRAARWASDVSMTLTVEGGGGRWLRRVDYGAQPEPLLDLLLSIAEDADALLMMDRFGGVRYRTRYRTPPARVTLPSGAIEKGTIDMVLEHGTLINTVYVYWGDDPQDFVIQPTDPHPSVATYGIRETTLATNLRFESGARAKGDAYIEKNLNLWQVPDVTMVMALTDDTAYDLLISLEEGDPITLADLPTGAPVASYDANVIGFTEVMHTTDYQMVLHLSEGLEPAGEDDGNWTEDGTITGGDDTGTMVIAGRVYRWHKFTSSGTLTLDAGIDIIADVLVVAGGGGGGGNSQSSSNGGGGGGAGGLYDGPLAIASGDSPFTVTVGTGGTGGAGVGIGGTGGNGSNGTDSSIGTVSVDGGGGGGGASPSGGTGNSGLAGGSGGGGGEDFGGGGAGITGQGTNGANSGGSVAGAGGGLAVTSTITGTSVTYAVGGLAYATPPANTGNGGGGGDNPASLIVSGTAGATGVVIVRYAVSPGGGDGSYAYNSLIPYESGITYE